MWSSTHLPEVVNRLVPRFGTCIDEDANLRLSEQIRGCGIGINIGGHTLRIFPIALNNQRCELIFFWFLAFKTNINCTGTKLLT